jgi:hypothetical protein
VWWCTPVIPAPQEGSRSKRIKVQGQPREVGLRPYLENKLDAKGLVRGGQGSSGRALVSKFEALSSSPSIKSNDDITEALYIDLGGNWGSEGGSTLPKVTQQVGDDQSHRQRPAGSELQANSWHELWVQEPERTPSQCSSSAAYFPV